MNISKKIWSNSRSRRPLIALTREYAIVSHTNAICGAQLNEYNSVSCVELCSELGKGLKTLSSIALNNSLQSQSYYMPMGATNTYQKD